MTDPASTMPSPEPAQSNGESKRVDLVFEGGGVKGIGLAGAYCELARRGWLAQRVAGTSAGAITAALVAAGYSADELEDLVLHDMDFRRFADGAGAFGQAWTFARHMGLHTGDYFLGWMRERLADRHVETFHDLLAAPATDDPASRHRLQVIASDLTLRRMLTLPLDAKACLGVEPDAMEVALAVRMSMSIPLFFEPVTYVNRITGNAHVITDGGMLSNFPVWLFDCPAGRMPSWPTFGLLLVAPSQDHPYALGPEQDTPVDGHMSLGAYLKAIARTAMEAHDRLYVERATFARTIPIDTRGVATTDFDIRPDRARSLFDSGREAATRFLSTWDFEAYKATFRARADEPSRRQVLLDHMRQVTTAAP